MLCALLFHMASYPENLVTITLATYKRSPGLFRTYRARACIHESMYASMHAFAHARVGVRVSG